MSELDGKSKSRVKRLVAFLLVVAIACAAFYLSETHEKAITSYMGRHLVAISALILCGAFVAAVGYAVSGGNSTSTINAIEHAVGAAALVIVALQVVVEHADTSRADQLARQQRGGDIYDTWGSIMNDADVRESLMLDVDALECLGQNYASLSRETCTPSCGAGQNECLDSIEHFTNIVSVLNLFERIAYETKHGLVCVNEVERVFLMTIRSRYQKLRHFVEKYRGDSQTRDTHPDANAWSLVTDLVDATSLEGHQCPSELDDAARPSE